MRRPSRAHNGVILNVRFRQPICGGVTNGGNLWVRVDRWRDRQGFRSEWGGPSGRLTLEFNVKWAFVVQAKRG